MTTERPDRGARHASDRCPALWRCRLPIRGQRGATHVSYASEEERADDIAAHYWIGCDLIEFPTREAALAFLPDAAKLERLRRIEEAARAVVSTEDQFVQTYSGADGKAADAAMGYLRAALEPEGSAQG